MILFIKFAKSNRNLVFKNDNNDFIYKICVIKKEGQLEGLDQNNGGNNIIEENCFNETSGLNYTLGEIEKENNYTEVRLKISVFKNCPKDTSIYKYCDNSTPIIGEKEFIFQIIINHPPVDSTEQTTIPEDSTEESTIPADSTEETTNAVDSTEQTAKPEDSTEQTTTPSDSMEQIEKSSTSLCNFLFL